MGISDFIKGKKHQGKKQIRKAVADRKKSPRVIQAEIETQLDSLEDTYKYIIAEQMGVYRNPDSSDHIKNRAKEKIEICCGGLRMVKLAREDVFDATSTALLAGNMRQLGKSIKTLNRLYNSAPDAKTKFLNRQIKKLENYSSNGLKDMDMRKGMDSHSVSTSGGAWEKNIEDLLAGNIDVDGFVKNTTNVDTPYDGYPHSFYSDEEFRRRDYDFGAPDNSAIDNSADAISRSADELDDYDSSYNDYMRDMEDMH